MIVAARAHELRRYAVATGARYHCEYVARRELVPMRGASCAADAMGFDRTGRRERLEVIQSANHRLDLHLLMNSEVVERLELKIAYLEKANADLSDVVYRQQRELDLLREHVLKLTDRLETASVEPTAYTAADEKPPHY